MYSIIAYCIHLICYILLCPSFVLSMHKVKNAHLIMKQNAGTDKVCHIIIYHMCNRSVGKSGQATIFKISGPNHEISNLPSRHSMQFHDSANWHQL